jgi:hypothetical protein
MVNRILALRWLPLRIRWTFRHRWTVDVVDGPVVFRRCKSCGNTKTRLM